MPTVPGHPRIAIDAGFLGGKPRIADTRIGVALILRNLAAGATVQWLLESYPGVLEEEDIKAALAYAADHLQPATVAAE